MNLKYTAAHVGTDYDDIVSQMTRILSENKARVRPVGIIFGPPSGQAVKECIIPRLSEYHYRSGDFIELFCVGFLKPSKDSFYEFDPFDGAAFSRATDSFQERTRWRYSGETDFLLLNSVWHERKQAAELDFITVMSLTFERAIKRKVIESVPEFMQLVISQAAQYEGDTFPTDFSDRIGRREFGCWIQKFLIQLIPPPLNKPLKSLVEGAQKAAHFRTQDLSVVQEDNDYLQCYIEPFTSEDLLLLAAQSDTQEKQNYVLENLDDDNRRRFQAILNASQT